MQLLHKTIHLRNISLLWPFSLFCLVISICCSGCSKNHETMHGYVEGRFTYLSTQIPGKLVNVYVKEGSTVNAGDPLFTLEAEPEYNELQKAQADLAKAQAQKEHSVMEVEEAELEFNRQAKLKAKNATTGVAYDFARIKLNKAKKQLAHDEANVNLLNSQVQIAKWQLANKTVNAPKKGIIHDIYYLPGEHVTETRPVLALLSVEDIRAVFFVPQKLLSRVYFGKKVEISCDGCPNIIPAQITLIGSKAEYTPPVVYTEKERERLVFRVEAMPINSDNADELHPGQPIDILLKR